MPVPTLLRAAEHHAIARLSLDGTVVDLGGDARSAYRRIIGGQPRYVTVNLDPKARPDVCADLEEPLPFPDASYDHVLLINVLEHVDRAEALLAESARILKPGGSVVIVVPYLFPYHPSPRDYRRYAPEALSAMARRAGLTLATLEPLGSGVLAARYVLLDRLLPAPVRWVRYWSVRPLVAIGDRILSWAASRLGKRYRADDYALGYLCVARKP